MLILKIHIYDTCESTINIISSISGGKIILTKNKGNSLIRLNPSNEQTQKLVKKH